MANELLLENWTVLGHAEATDAVTFEARYDLEPEACPRCGVIGAKFYGHGVATARYTDAPHFGKRAVIKAAVKRLRCLECKATFMQPLPDMADGFKLTKRCVQFIERESTKDTWAAIARRVGVDEKTVRTIARAAAAEDAKRRGLYAPMVLGIDELRLDGKLRAIMVDGAYRRVIDILPSNDKKTVNHWLSWLPDRDEVRIVTMDMWGAYRDVVEHLMPNARIIVDRFHIQRMLNKALDTVRVRVSRQQRSKKARMAVLRKRSLLQMSRHSLRPHVLVMLEAWLANNPVIRDAWQTKEAFADVWENSKSSREAEMGWIRVRDAIPESVQEEFGMNGFCGTVWRWYEHIFPFFEPEFRFTNAYTEAANGIIKIANRAGRGYRFEQIRARALAAQSVTGKRMMVCEECLKRFPADAPGMWFHLGIALCPDCSGFNILAMGDGGHHSTETSG